MNTYSIFVKQNRRSKSLDDVILVKEGFNVFAMIFNIFWFLSNKLYLFTIISFVIINFSMLFFSHSVFIVFLFLFCLLIGFEANNLLLYRFQKEKYFFVGYSTGKNKEEAQLRFLDEVNKEAKNNNQVVY